MHLLMAAVIAATPVPATPSDISDQVAARLRSLGAEVDILDLGQAVPDIDDLRRHVLSVRTDTGRFYVYFSPCPKSGRSCARLDLVAQARPALPVTNATLAEWSARNPAAHAALDQIGNPELEMVFTVSGDDLNARIDLEYAVWTEAMRSFIALVMRHARPGP